MNVADGQARPPADQPWHSLHRAALRAGDAASRDHAASHRAPGQPAASEHAGLGRLLRGMTDATWLAADPAVAPLPRDVWLPSVQVLVAREQDGSTAGLALAAKGGHNGEHHNHNDVGSFIVAVDGVPVIVDAGRPTYTAATFGPERYTIWTMQSAWHSVPEPRGTQQGSGPEFRADDVAAAIADAETTLSLDLARAYPPVGVAEWRRTVALHRGTGRGRVVIEDAWRIEPGADSRPTSLHLLVAGEITPVEDGVRVTPIGGARPIRIRWAAGIRNAIVERVLDDPMLSDVWGARLTRIDLDVTHLDHAVVTVELDPDTDKESR